MSTVLPADVQAYIDGIPPQHRPLFDRLHGLIVSARPDAEVSLSYKMPAYTAGRRRLHVGAWKHGISLYGWGADRDDGFSGRHPDLLASKSTLRLRPDDAANIPDEEFLGFIRAALTA
jgi:uncharacterized protein YdhG (YjbR/CyaY superfamily)